MYARMRLYNIKYRFPKKEQGVTVAEWKKIPDPEKEALVNDFTGKAKVAESRAVNLAEERSVMEAHLSNSGGSTTGSVSGSVHTQAFSDDECDLECQTRSFAAERRVYTIQDTCEHLPASRQCLSAEVIGVEAFRGGPVAKSDAKVCLEGVDCVAAAADIMGLDAKACAEGPCTHNANTTGDAESMSRGVAKLYVPAFTIAKDLRFLVRSRTSKIPLISLLSLCRLHVD
eukprot:gene1634-2276_t